jgi:hypothetical protein
MPEGGGVNLRDELFLLMQDLKIPSFLVTTIFLFWLCTNDDVSGFGLITLL